MSQKMHRLLLGAHMSVSGGMEKAFERAESIGCTTMQIFSRSNRQWKSKAITRSEAELFRETQKQSKIKPVIVHASYLINLAAPDQEILEKSIEATKEELERCELLGVPYLVLHPGSRLKADEDAALDTIIHSLDQALDAIEGETMILLELMAGQGTGMCYTFEQLAYILKEAKNKERIGVCFDTCHAFAAGYDFTSPKSYRDMWQHFDATIGLNKLKVIHLNDSKKELGSRVDRHEEIGRGKIGLEGFELLINDDHLFDIAKILETPNDSLDDYANNMRILIGLLSEKNKEILGITGKSSQ